MENVEILIILLNTPTLRCIYSYYQWLSTIILQIVSCYTILYSYRRCVFVVNLSKSWIYIDKSDKGTGKCMQRCRSKNRIEPRKG